MSDQTEPADKTPGTPKTPDPVTLIQELLGQREYRNPLMLEISGTEFQEWRHSPVSQAFLLFLAHRAAALIRENTDRMLTGVPMERADSLELRGRFLELWELCSKDLSDIQQFYGKEKPSRTASSDQGKK